MANKTYIAYTIAANNAGNTHEVLVLDDAKLKKRLLFQSGDQAEEWCDTLEKAGYKRLSKPKTERGR